VEARALAVLLARLGRSGEVVVPLEKSGYLQDYLECRTAAKGGRVLRCEDFGTHTVAYNACNRRGCPVCSRKNQRSWQSRMGQRLLPTCHHHLTFSFPDCLTDQWVKHPKWNVAKLFKAVRTVIRKLERERKVTLGTMMVFQSHCRGLAYKAHVHCLITGGGLDDGDQWQPLGTLPLARMTEWLKQSLSEAGDHKGWQIHASVHQAGGEAVVQYLGQRLNGSVVTASEVTEHDGRIEIQVRGGSVELDKSTFALRYLGHIPQKGTVLVRNCGLYSNRQKRRLQVAREQLGEQTKPVPVDWAERCPRCRGQMEVIMTSLLKPLEFDHERLGFGVDPPYHRELSKAS